LLSADPGGIGSAFHRAEEGEKQKDPGFALIPLNNEFRKNKDFQMINLWNSG